MGSKFALCLWGGSTRGLGRLHPKNSRMFLPPWRSCWKFPDNGTNTVSSLLYPLELPEQRQHLVDQPVPEGFGEIRGPRLSLMASQVADAFATKDRINPDKIWDGGYLPTKDARNILGK